MLKNAARPLVFVVLLALVLVPWAKLHAAPTNRPEVSVAPFLQNVQVGTDPEDLTINYTNDSDRTQTLNLSVADFGSLDQSGGIAFLGTNFSKLLDKYTLTPWISVSPGVLTLEKGQTASATATIISTPEMAPGGHYGAIVATVENSGNGGQNQVSLKQKISSLVFAVKTGGEHYDMKLLSVRHNGNIFTRPSEAKIDFKATGNTHVVPRGIVYLKHGNKTVARGVINEQSGIVLPGTDRIFTVPLDQLAKPKIWDTTYKLQVDYRYDGISQFATKSYTIRAVSPILVLLIILFIALVLFLAWWFWPPPKPKKAKKPAK